jgi:predicted phage gp36 major capsid-like protein
MTRSKGGPVATVRAPNTSDKRGYWLPVTEQSNDQLSRYQERLEQVIGAAREGVERQAPEVLEKLAATARNVAERLDDMARDARQKQAEKQASPAPTGTSECEPKPPDDP